MAHSIQFIQKKQSPRTVMLFFTFFTLLLLTTTTFSTLINTDRNGIYNNSANDIEETHISYYDDDLSPPVHSNQAIPSPTPIIPTISTTSTPNHSTTSTKTQQNQPSDHYRPHYNPLTASAGTENEAVLFPTSLTDGEDVFFLQGSIILHNTSTFFRQVGNFINFTSVSRVPDLDHVDLNAYCYIYDDDKPPVIFHCANTTYTAREFAINGEAFIFFNNFDPTIKTPIRDLLHSTREIFFIAKFTLNDYILLYPLDLQMSFTYRLDNGGGIDKATFISPTVATDITRHYYETLSSLFWYTPCFDKECKQTKELHLVLEGWSAPAKDDNKEILQRYALKLSLGVNASFNMTQMVDKTCQMNYHNVEVITLDSSSTDHLRKNIIIVIENYRTATSDFPVFESNTLFLQCPQLSIVFHNTTPKDYLLTVTSGVLERPTTWNTLTPEEILAKLRWLPLSSYTDLWRYKQYTPQAEFTFQPRSYAPDSSAWVRGYLTYESEPPKHDDRFILCGVEEAAVVSFNVHQLIENQQKELVWASFSPFDGNEQQTSKAYPDPFDPSWTDADFAFDKAHDDERSMLISQYNDVNGDGDSDNYYGNDHKNNKNNKNDKNNKNNKNDKNDKNNKNNKNNNFGDKNAKFNRFITRRNQYLNEGKYTDLDTIAPNLSNNVRNHWERLVSTQNTPREQFTSFSDSDIPFHQAPQSFHSPSSYTNTFNIQSTPMTERICVRLHPFQHAEKLTKGTYWFVGQYKLAEDGDRYAPNSVRQGGNNDGNDDDDGNDLETQGIESNNNNNNNKNNNTQLAPLNSNGNPSYLDVLYYLLGSHTRVGAGLFNWKFRGNFALVRDSKLWFQDKVPNYYPPGDARDDSSISHLYPYNAKLPPSYIHIDHAPTNSPYSFQSMTVYASGFQVVLPQQLMVQLPQKNYFSAPSEFSSVNIPLTCTIMHGKYNNNDINGMSQLRHTAYFIGTLIIVEFLPDNDFIVDPGDGFNGLYFHCDGLYLISEGYEMFNKPTSLGIHLHSSFGDDNNSNNNNNNKFTVDNNININNKNADINSKSTNTSNNNVNIKNNDAVSTTNPLVVTPYWTFFLTLPPIVNANDAPKPSLQWHQSWFQRYIVKNLLAILLSTGIAILLLILAVTLCGCNCLRSPLRKCLKKCCNYYYDDDDDDDNDRDGRDNNNDDEYYNYKQQNKRNKNKNNNNSNNKYINHNNNIIYDDDDDFTELGRGYNNHTGNNNNNNNKNNKNNNNNNAFSYMHNNGVSFVYNNNNSNNNNNHNNNNIDPNNNNSNNDSHDGIEVANLDIQRQNNNARAKKQSQQQQQQYNDTNQKQAYAQFMGGANSTSGSYQPPPRYNVGINTAAGVGNHNNNNSSSISGGVGGQYTPSITGTIANSSTTLSPSRQTPSIRGSSNNTGPGVVHRNSGHNNNNNNNNNNNQNNNYGGNKKTRSNYGDFL